MQQQRSALRILNGNRKAVCLFLNLDHMEEIAVPVVGELGFVAIPNDRFQIGAHATSLSNVRQQRAIEKTAPLPSARYFRDRHIKDG